MADISNAIKEIGSAESNLDSDEALERLSNQDITKGHLDKHKSSVDVNNSNILKKINMVKGLISQVGENSEESEALVAQAIAEACGNDPVKMEWLAGELGIDISKLQTSGNELFGKDDLRALSDEVEANTLSKNVGNIARSSGLAAYYPGTIDWRSNKIDNDAYSNDEKLVEVTRLVSDLSQLRDIETDALKRYKDTDPHKAEVKTKIMLLEKAIADILKVKAELESSPASANKPTTTAGTTEAATEAAETAKEKATIQAVLAKVLRSPSTKPEDIKVKLVEALSNVDNVGQFLDAFMESLTAVKDIPGLTDGTAKALITKTGLDIAIAGVKKEFGDKKLTPAEAKKAADLIMNGAAELQAAQEDSKPFEVTPLTSAQLESRASDLMSLEGIAASPTTKLEASKVKTQLTTLLEKAIASKNLEGLRAIGKVLGLAINETDVDKVIAEINKNRSTIDSRINAISKAVDGKTPDGIKAATIEENQKNAKELIKKAAQEFPEHVGTARWETWVSKLANGETQKSFAEYLTEDEPVQGLEGVFLMIKKLIMQFKDMLSGINPKEGEQTLSQKLQAQVDAGIDKVNKAYYEKIGAEFKMTAEEVKANMDGLAIYNENRDLLEKNPDLNIKEMDKDGNGKVSNAEKVKYFQESKDNNVDMKPFFEALRSVDERVEMKDVLASGLSLSTIDDIYNLKSNMGDKPVDIKVEDGNLVINGDAVELKAGGDEAVTSALRKHLKDEDGTVTVEEAEAHSAKFDFIKTLMTKGRLTEDILEADMPDELLSEGERRDPFDSLLEVPDNFWAGYKLTKEDLQNFVDKASAFKTGSPFHIDSPDWYEIGGQIVDESGVARDYAEGEAKDDKLEVNGAGDNWSDHKFMNVKSFFSWLKQQ